MLSDVPVRAGATTVTDGKAITVKSDPRLSSNEASMANLLAPNTILHGRYRIVRVVGQGGMGAVYLAEDTSLPGLAVAVKENFDSSQGAQEQFQREAVLLARLRHPALPQVTDHFIEPPGRQYLVMDYVEGEDLEQLVAQHGPLPETSVMTWARQLLDALAYMHTWVDPATGRPTPIIHRDIKPGNAKITPAGQAMLMDFGIAKADQAGRATVTAARAVTPGFSPLEQYGQGATDARSDIYALGCTLYYLLTGVVPPEATQRASGAPLAPPRQTTPSLSREVEAAVLKAMSLDPKQRFQKVMDFRKAFLTGSTATPIAAPASPPPITRRSLWRYLPAFILALPGALVGFVAALTPSCGWGAVFAFSLNRPLSGMLQIWEQVVLAVLGGGVSPGLARALGIVLLLVSSAGVMLSLYWLWRLPFVGMYFGAKLGLGDRLSIKQAHHAVSQNRVLMSTGFGVFILVALGVGLLGGVGSGHWWPAALAGVTGGLAGAAIVVVKWAAR